MENDYNPEDFEWRFQQTLKDHREKLDALPEERRKSVEEGLRRKFDEFTKDFWALDGHANYLEELDSLIGKQQRETGEYVDRAQQAWKRSQQRSADRDDDKDRGR